MKIGFSLPGLKLYFASLVTRPSYGIKSTVPDKESMHYLLMDFDIEEKEDWRIPQAIVLETLYERLRCKIVSYPTRRGFHVIAYKKHGFKDTAIEMLKTPYVDIDHIAMGLTRGYWFLEVPDCILKLFWKEGFKVSLMKLQRAKGRRGAG